MNNDSYYAIQSMTVAYKNLASTIVVANDNDKHEVELKLLNHITTMIKNAEDSA